MIRDILVHLDLLPACPGRLHLALQMARRLGARLTGGLVAPVPDSLAFAESGDAAMTYATSLVELKAEIARVGARCRGPGNCSRKLTPVRAARGRCL